MSQPKSETEGREQGSLALSALFPQPFIERLVSPLFAEPARAELAEAYLGSPMAYACAEMCQSRAVDLEVLHGRAAYESIKSRRTRARGVELAGALAGEGIESVAFKGLATSLSVYPHPAYRLLPDVDFLYREADLPRLAKFLAARGFVTSLGPLPTRPWGVLIKASFAPIYQADRTFFLDVHRAVDEPPASRGLDSETIFSRGVTLNTDWGPCMVACHEHSFAIAALHIYRDFYRPEALKGLFDGCLILNRFGRGLDWPHIEALARRGRFVNRLVFFRDLLEALGAGRAPLFEDRSLSRWLRPLLALVVENCRTLDWQVMSDGRKMLLEAGLLDSPLATVRLNWRRLRSLAAPPVHYLPGVPVEEAEDFPPQA